ncbi:MAG TPA: type II secretion system protein [Telluria sp.]|jgi:MSHA pilin protein MshD
MSIKRQRGLTMIELIVFIVIVGVAAAGMLGVISYTSSRSADPWQRKQAMLVAEALLEEVQLAKFTYCHPNDSAAETATNSVACASATLRENVGLQVAGETRPFFNINDYVSTLGVATSMTAGDTSGRITDATGAAMVSGNYTAKVTINAAAIGPAGLRVGTAGGTADNDALRITVDVTYGASQHIVLDTYRTRYAPNSLP